MAKSKISSQVWRPLIFLSPAIAIYVFVMIFPMFYSLYLTFHDISGPVIEYVGLQNYRTLLFNDPIFWLSLKNNAIWLLLALTIPVSLGLILAEVMNKSFKGRLIFRSLFYYPHILSLTIVALIWVWMYNPTYGLINTVLRALGLDMLILNWIGDTRIALFSVFVADIWWGTGFAMILFLGGMQSIPGELYECAVVEGANKLQMFFRITIPLLREAFIVITVLYTIGTMQLFDIIFAMTLGGPARSTYVITVYMYFNAFKFYKIGLGCTVSWLMTLIVAAVVIPYVLYMAKER
jgi:raffinose/stachyose/melibiose transport system permease protein